MQINNKAINWLFQTNTDATYIYTLLCVQYNTIRKMQSAQCSVYEAGTMERYGLHYIELP